MSYKLTNNIFLIEGSKNGVLLNTNTGAIYSINSQACKILKFEVQDEKFWESLLKMGLAERDISESNSLPKIPRLSHSTKLDFVWFEIVTDDCNERCVHCYADAMPKSYRHHLSSNSSTESAAPESKPINEKTSTKPRMSYENWLNLISESFRLGCRKCQFIGGEPFLYKGQNHETVLDLAEFAINTGYKLVEIYTNGTLLTEQKIKRIKELGINIAISLYSDEPEIHDSITRTTGSYQKTVESIRKLKELDIPTRVEIVVMKANQHTVNSTLDFRNKLGVSGKHPDPLRPSGRGSISMLQPDFEYLSKFGLILNPAFTANLERIIKYSSGHSCLMGKLTITEFGDIFPCIFARNFSCGNYFTSENLESVVSDNFTQKIWNTTKDNVMVCQDCEYRYVCFDCRPLSESSALGKANFIDAPYPRCTYNPYTGEWRGGLWEIGDEGLPFYNREYADSIERTFSNTTNNDTGGEVEH